METKQNWLTIFTDGGSRGNPGPAAYGFVIKAYNKILYKQGKAIGIETNNVAEYSAILASLEWVEKNIPKEILKIEFKMDSLLACQQLKGIFKIKKEHLKNFVLSIKTLEKKIGLPIEYIHIPRELNKEADSLVNAALDKNL